MRKKNAINFKCLNDVVLTEKQHQFYKTIRNNQITLATGAAGTSKTFTACFTALKMYQDKKIDKIILTKPIVESGESLGFLPGDIASKIDPFMESFYNTVEKIGGEDFLRILKEFDVIEARPLAYMRGMSFDNCLMILDEAQNVDIRSLMLFITRMGKDSKVLLMGDISQTDLIRSKDVALETFYNMIKDVEGVGTHKFDRSDIVRNKILIDIVDKYEAWKYANSNQT